MMKSDSLPRRLVASAAVVGLGYSLAACNASGSLNAKASADIANALAIACPVVGAVQGSGLSLNKVQTAALSTLALACPPNPPPTNVAIAAVDILSAYTILAPVIGKK